MHEHGNENQFSSAPLPLRSRGNKTSLFERNTVAFSFRATKPDIQLHCSLPFFRRRQRNLSLSKCSMLFPILGSEKLLSDMWCRCFFAVEAAIFNLLIMISMLFRNEATRFSIFIIISMLFQERGNDIRFKNSFCRCFEPVPDCSRVKSIDNGNYIMHTAAFPEWATTTDLPCGRCFR